MFCVCCRVPNPKPGGFFAEAADGVPDVEAALARRAMYRRRAAFSSAPARHPEQGEFIIRGASVLTLDPHIGNLTEADIHVRDGVIVNVGRDLKAAPLHRIDGHGRIAVPGFVAGHRHICSEMVLPESDHPAALPDADPADIYKILRLALLEAVSAGTTTVHHCASDIGGEHAEAAILAQIDSGVRGRFSYPLDLPLSLAPTDDQHALNRIEQTWFASSSEHLLDLGITVTRADENTSVLSYPDRTALPVSSDHLKASAANDGLAAVTLEAARALNLDHCIGSLAPGKRADLVLIDGGRNKVPMDQAEAFARRAKASDVVLVSIDGRLRKRNGVLTEPNEGLIRREGEAAIARLRGT
jgi:cytosine/adenosine deaminase-related metal-dependent hydrolase